MVSKLVYKNFPESLQYIENLVLYYPGLADV